jgi:hypothetical protein
MGISGNLRTMELAELLQWLSSAQKTGTLVVDNGRLKKQIMFNDGRILSSSSTDPREHLGAILVSHGFITDAQLAQAIELQRANKVLLGKILTTIGAIAEADLHRMLRFKAEETVYDTFTWPEGDFKFLDGELPAPETIVPISLDVTVMVLEGMQRLDEGRRIREAIPSQLAVPVRVAPFDESEMGELDAHVLDFVDDDRSIEEICYAAHATEFHVGRCLLKQLLAQRIKLVRPRVAPASTPTSEGHAVEEPPSPARISGDSLIQEARQRLAKQEFEPALRHARAAKALEPENRKIDAAIAEIEAAIRKEVDKAEMKPSDVPMLARPLEELAKLRLTPQEGFLLTRIDGAHDLRSLYKIGPIPQLEMQLLFAKLLRDGHVALKPKK